MNIIFTFLFKLNQTAINICPPASPPRAVAPNSDVAFVLDSSNSVNARSFEHQKEFVNKIAQKLQLAPTLTQAGVIKYGERASIEINFDDNYRLASLVRSVSSLQHDSARESRLDLALRLAKEKMLTNEHGARANSDKVLLLLLFDTKLDKFMFLLIIFLEVHRMEQFLEKL